MVMNTLMSEDIKVFLLCYNERICKQKVIDLTVLGYFSVPFTSCVTEKARFPLFWINIFSIIVYTCNVHNLCYNKCINERSDYYELQKIKRYGTQECDT